MKTNLYFPLLIVLVSAVLFIPFLGNVHLFDWDEINFAEAAREMIISGDYLNVQINYLPFWEKPPLFIWMQVVSMKTFGINEFAARLPNAICGIVSLIVLYHIGTKLFSLKFGLIWAFVYMGSLLPFFYFKSGIIDPWFNLFIFLGIYYSFLYVHKKDGNLKYSILSAFFIGLSILTKGPVGLLIWGLSAFLYFIVARKFATIQLADALLFGIVLSLVGGFWFLILAINGHVDVIQDFIRYQIELFNTEGAGHGGFFGYHFVVLLFGVFPTSLFALQSFFLKKSEVSPLQKDFKLQMKILFWVVLILFSIVQTKILHYSSMCYFPLTFLGAFVIDKIINNKLFLHKFILILISFIGFIFSLLILLLILIDKNKSWIIKKNFINDQFAIANLQANVHWSGFEMLIGCILLLGIFLFIFFQKRRRSIIILYVSCILFTFLTLVLITPKIEKYSQNAAIEFYKNLDETDCYIETLGFMSYAHLFYSKKIPQKNKNATNIHWLLTGDIDKDAYFVIRNSNSDDLLSKYPQLQKLYTKNGFVFCKRKVAF